MMVVYVIALGIAALLWLVRPPARPGAVAGGAIVVDGGIGGAEGEAGETTSRSSRWRWPIILLVLSGTFGGLGALLHWTVEGLPAAAEVSLAALGGAGLVVILCSGPGRGDS